MNNNIVDPAPIDVLSMLNTSIISLFGFFIYHGKQHKLLIITLFIMLIVDYLTGVTNSIIKGNKFDKDIAIKGILKKFNYIYIILATFSFDSITDKVIGKSIYISSIVIVWLILNEIISTFSNITDDNIVPKNLVEYIKKLRKDIL